MFLSEMAPSRFRGALNNMFQLATASGILIAQIVNFAVKDIGPHQWRVSLAIAGDSVSGQAKIPSMTSVIIAHGSTTTVKSIGVPRTPFVVRSSNHAACVPLYKQGHLAQDNLEVFSLAAAAGAPALLLFFGMLLLPDTPNSLAERGRPDQARRVLERIRGSSSVDDEMAGINTAVEKGSKVCFIITPTKLHHFLSRPPQILSNIT